MLTIVALSLAGLLVVGAGVVAGAVLWADSRIERIGDPFAGLDAAERPTVAPEVERGVGAPLNILVLGSDSRISAGDPDNWEMGAQRTDAIMIVHVAADRRDVTVVGIPRDSWVPIPGHADAKINAAYSWGGPALMIQTVEALMGVRIDHFAVADFESFEGLTDALGGVQVSVPEDTYSKGRLVVKAGDQRLDGEQALAYTRQRYGLPGGDLDRMKRQQAWMRSIVQEAATTGTLTNPVRLANLVEIITGAVAVDDGLDRDALLSLATSLRHLRGDDVELLTVPLDGFGWSPDGRQSIVRLDLGALELLAESIADDSVAQYVRDNAEELNLLDGVVR